MDGDSEGVYGRFARTSRRRLIEIEIASGFRDRLFFGLLQRLFETLGQGVRARPLVCERLLEGRVAPFLLFGENVLRVRQLDIQPRVGLAMRDDSSEIDVDHQ
jgi:hypothetical protein